MTELFKGVFSGGKSRLYAVLFLLAVMLEVAGYADSGRMGERKESNVQVSGKVVDVYEEAITHDKALPSSTDRGNGMMVALIEDLNAYEKMCKQLQLLGVTEITDFDAKAIIPIPGNMRFPMEPNLDVLDMEVAVAKKHGINKIWLVYGWAAYGEQMSATDKRVNAMTPEFFEEQCRFMDAVAKKNTQYGKNIFGFFFDEPWFNSSMTDFSAHVDSFRVFCEKEYGEIYPGTTLPKTDNPEDKWWRRLVVFRYCVYEGFFGMLQKPVDTLGVSPLP